LIYIENKFQIVLRVVIHMYYWIFCIFVFNIFSQNLALRYPIKPKNRQTTTRNLLQPHEYAVIGKIAEAEKLNKKISISFNEVQETTVFEQELKKSAQIKNNQVKNTRNLFIAASGLSAIGFYYLNKMAIQAKVNEDIKDYENLKYLIKISHGLVMTSGAIGAKYAFDYALRKKSELRRIYISPFPNFIENLLLRYRR